MGTELIITRPSLETDANTHGDACDQQTEFIVSLCRSIRDTSRSSLFSVRIRACLSKNDESVGVEEGLTTGERGARLFSIKLGGRSTIRLELDSHRHKFREQSVPDDRTSSSWSGLNIMSVT